MVEGRPKFEHIPRTQTNYPEPRYVEKAKSAESVTGSAPVVVMTEAEYKALESKDPSTVYVIKEEK